MTRTLDRLEMKGLVQCVRSREDHRVVHILLTENGRKTAKTIPAALSSCMNAFLTGFMRDLVVELKALRLHGMAGAWAELAEQGANGALDSSRWLL